MAEKLMVLFKKMQRDDKKDVLKFEYRGGKDDPKDEKGNPKKITLPQSVYAMVGEMVNIEIEGTGCGPVTAELSKANKDSKKVTLDLNLKGDSEDKALELYRKAGQNVTLTIEPSQASLLDEEQADPHEGIEYAVDMADGSVTVKNEYEEHYQTEEELAGDDGLPDDDELPF